VLAHESLDVHRLMVRQDAIGSALRRLEGWLLRDCDLLLVSSPGFVREHLAPAHGAALPPVALVENKMLGVELAALEGLEGPRIAAGPPWRIGWYKVIRCRRSLEILAGLVRRLPGLVEVEIRGRPSLSAVPEFEAVVAG
jgi:succinoglycan biosynthesis protein ExoL